MNTKEITKLLRARYSRPAYAFLSQVRNQTGFSNMKDGIRTADGLAMSLYPSRGLHLYGFEIKVSRSDWMHEVKDPSKADAIGRYCDFFYVVIADKNMIKEEEIPTTWGILAPYGSGLTQVKEPKLLNAEPMSRQILAGLMRNLDENYVEKEGLKEEIKSRVDRHIKSEEFRAKFQLDDVKRMEEKIKRFEDLAGIKIDTYTGDNVAMAVRAVLESKKEWGNPVKHLIDLREDVQRIMNLIDESVGKINSTKKID